MIFWKSVILKRRIIILLIFSIKAIGATKDQVWIVYNYYLGSKF